MILGVPPREIACPATVILITKIQQPSRVLKRRMVGLRLVGGTTETAAEESID